MKQPLWILNISLLFLFLLVIIFIFVQRPEPVERVTIEPKISKVPQKEIELKTSVIIENDLFATFSQKEPYMPDKPEVSEEIPPPPAEVSPAVPPASQPSFLEPLPITLTGIVMTDRPDENRAVIYNTQMKEEMSYQIGSKIEDAQLVRIFAHKVIIIRSNGQQEVLYINQEDAEADAPSTVHGYWDSVIKQIAHNIFIVDPLEFTRKVRSLAHVIDLLDLTWAYQGGKSIGCRVGELEKESFGPLLDLNPGDIIESVAGISTTNETDAYQAYEKVINLPKHTQVPIVINRGQQRFTITVQLSDISATEFIDVEHTKGQQIKREKTHEEMEQEKIELMHQQYQFAPTVKELEKQEQEAMWQQGKQGAVSQKLKTRNVISGM